MLPDKTEATIYRLSGLCAFLATACLIVPRFVSNPEGGFASGASAVLALIVMLAMALGRIRAGQTDQMRSLLASIRMAA